MNDALKVAEGTHFFVEGTAKEDLKVKGVTPLGVVLIILGLAGLVWPVISYTDTDTVVDIGPLEVTAQTEERVPIPPLAGGAAIVAGITLVVVGKRRHA